jgi:hypothetical protein
MTQRNEIEILRLSLRNDDDDYEESDAERYAMDWRATFLQGYPETLTFLLKHKIEHYWAIYKIGDRMDDRFGELERVLSFRIGIDDHVKAVHFKLWFEKPDIINFHLAKQEKPIRQLCLVRVNLEI